MVSPPPSRADQIAAQLRDDIAAGTPAVGDALPSEPVLAERFGVSRVTVNRAVAKLRELGLVEVRRGVDTRVIAAVPPVRLAVPAEVWAAVETRAAAEGLDAEEWAVKVLRDAAHLIERSEQ